jgi:hypothetical protein
MNENGRRSGLERSRRSPDDQNRERTDDGRSMMEDPTIVRMNIARYQSILLLDLTPEKRATVEKLLVEAQRGLVQPPVRTPL